MGTVVDARLTVDGNTRELALERATVGNDGVSISTLMRDTGLVTVDPGFMNTSSCESAITYIDGDAGILRYRGYPIEQLADKSTFLEVAYLLIHGELPTEDQLDGLQQPRRPPHARPLGHQDLPRGLPARRAPDGDPVGRGERAVHVLPGVCGPRR